MPSKMFLPARGRRGSCGLALTLLLAACAGSAAGEGTDPLDGEAGPDAAGPAPGIDAAGGAPAVDAGPPAEIDAGGGSGEGACCDDGDCLCHGPPPSELTSGAGPFATARLSLATGTVHYPTDAEPPFAAVAICAGYTNTGPEMTAWASFYASHGIVAIVVTTSGIDSPAVRASKLLAAIDELEAENLASGSPLFAAMSGRYGTSGYSYGGGGSTLASAARPGLRTSVALAPHSGVGTGLVVPTLFVCGQSDGTAPCSMAQGDYGEVPATTAKMLISIPGATHFSWFAPTHAGGGLSGKYALAFQKVFLEGDQRWRPFLLGAPGGSATQTTNIVP